ncbi:MAG TPA: c-type cytochrome [Bryobacteraceae bacterium]|jgi:mono/diheme cytochrome c family protein|nr:c-type cytochrome [Bryobacteraceae bacterium]
MRHRLLNSVLAGGLALLATVIIGQEVPNPAPPGKAPAGAGHGGYNNLTPAQRAAATRAFLGLGPAPDKAAAARGAPLFQQNCAFCHGPQARGAEGPSLITSDVVLGDDHGEHLVPFLRKGRPEKGMPSFASVPDDQLQDIAEFLHLQVDDVANRGTYHVLNILVGDPTKGQAYVAAKCMSCHTAGAFAHIASKFRAPDQLQRGWIWPSHPAGNSLAITATVEMTDGGRISGRVTQVSDFRITLVDGDGETHVIDRGPGVGVQMKDPLAPHEAFIKTLTNDDMHNVTAYLETLK